MAIIENQEITNVGKDIETRESSNTGGEDKMIQTPQKIKNRSTIWPRYSTSGYLYQNMKTLIQKDICTHMFNGPFLGKNFRHRESVSSNYYLPAMNRYLGFRLPISGQGESGHYNPLSLPTQLWELKEHLVHSLSLASPPQESCSYIAFHAQWSWLSTGKQRSWLSHEWSHYLPGKALFPPPPCRNTALGLRQPRVDKRLVWYCMISPLCNFKTIQMNTHAK